MGFLGFTTFRGRRRGEEEFTGSLEIRPGSRAQEAVVADPGKAAGQDVLEEAGDEVVRRQRHAASVSGSGVGVAEGDAATGERFDALVGERDAVDVMREIERGVMSAADLLDVNGPRSVPDVGIDMLGEGCVGEGVAHLCPEDL